MFLPGLALTLASLTFAINAVPLADSNAASEQDPSSMQDHREHHNKHGHHHGHGHGHPHGDTFAIHIHNNCPAPKTFGIYGVTPSFQMVQHGPTASIPTNQHRILHAPFHGVGLRVTATADKGLDYQWNPQALFEFGYSEYAGQTGTAYDISLMAGSEPGEGMAIEVIPNGQGSGTCERKKCLSPENCPASQGWTNPDQSGLGNPADTVCYKGKTAFKVTWCPS